jgi:hypothetical protein
MSPIHSQGRCTRMALWGSSGQVSRCKPINASLEDALFTVRMGDGTKVIIVIYIQNIYKPNIQERKLAKPHSGLYQRYMYHKMYCCVNILGN